jgi:predicted dehydrogenase
VRSAIFQRICGTPAWSWENWYARAECSGGGILDLHIHDVDLVNWYFGRPSRVSSTGVYVPSEGVRSVCTNYTCQTAPMVTAIGGWYTHCSGFLMALTVEFDQATVEYASNLSPTLKICSAAGVETPTFPTMDAYQEEVKYFLQCIVGGQKPDRVPPEATADAVKIVEAEARSVKTGKSVAVK